MLTPPQQRAPMRRTLAILSLLLAATTAHAAPCKTQGDTSARELTFNLNDPKVQAGLSVAFQFGLLPPEFPENDIAQHREPCSRGTFPYTNGMAMELHGEDDDSPPRWAMSPMPGPTVYIALLPKPDAALAAAEAARHAGQATLRPGDMMYAIAMTRGDTKRTIYHFFDRIPDDARLKSLLRPIVISQGKVLVTYDVKTGRVEAK